MSSTDHFPHTSEGGKKKTPSWWMDKSSSSSLYLFSHICLPRHVLQQFFSAVHAPEESEERDQVNIITTICRRMKITLHLRCLRLFFFIFKGAIVVVHIHNEDTLFPVRPSSSSIFIVLTILISRIERGRVYRFNRQNNDDKDLFFFFFLLLF